MAPAAHTLNHYIVFFKKLLPSYMVSHRSNGKIKKTGANRYTSLDGLRGVAACSVTTYHSLYPWQYTLYFGDGLSYADAQKCDIPISQERYDRRSRALQWPITRILIMGPVAVAMFFVISGFVLSRRPLRLARQQNWEQLLVALSSSTLRRPLRLFLPLVVATFGTMILRYLNLMSRGLDQDKDSLTSILSPRKPPYRYFPDQFVDWLGSLWRILKVWEWAVYAPPYDNHLWTIPLELRGSMLIFITTLMLC